MIKGIPVSLFSVVQIGTDQFGRPVYDEAEIVVDNVLVAPMSDQEVLETLNLTGRKAVYQLAIPKGDTNDWENRKVSFFGRNWRVIGHPTEGIVENIPLLWNKKVRVENYD